MTMKKRVLCFFSLILYLLTACGLLSQKIEAEMATQVLLSLRTAAGSLSPTSQPLRVLFTDEGDDHLYEVVDGTGWNSGLRIREIPEGFWTIGYAIGPYVAIPGGRDYRFVESASRQPPEGKLARIIEEFEITDDRYLLLFPEGVPESMALPENTAVIAQSRNALLLDVPNAELPFFEHRAKTLSDTLGAAERVFSLTETEQFLTALPAIALTALLLASALILWAFSCLLSIRPEQHKGLIWFNAALILASLYALLRVLGSFDLPASLLPARNILDWQHYADTLSLIFGTLETFADNAQGLLTLKAQAFAQSAQILQWGFLATLALVLTEALLLFFRSHRRKKPRYAGKYLAPKKKQTK